MGCAAHGHIAYVLQVFSFAAKVELILKHSALKIKISHSHLERIGYIDIRFCFTDCGFFTGITKAQYLAAAKKGTSLWFVCVNCQERSHRSTDHTENNDSEDDEDDVCFFVSSQFVVILLND